MINGTLDQVRRDVTGVCRIWDIKTSMKGAWEIAHGYAYQLAAYAMGASALLCEPVEPGGFIRTRSYVKRGVLPGASPDGVFIEVPWRLADATRILDGVRLVVAQIRSGYFWLGPGDHCSYCPAGGVQSCLPKLLSLPTI